MADPFSIAVSVAGLASLGIQLLQGLNQYAGSALDSKGRIKAISTDIDLTVQVVQTLDTTIQDEANRAIMKDDAARLVQDTIAQCRDIFTKIQNTLPESPRKRDVIIWPFIEPKLDLLRGNLEKLKTSLQLLMNVIVLAAMSKRQVEQASLYQQRKQIEKLLEEKAAAEARLAILERDHAQALVAESPASTTNDCVPPKPGQPGPGIGLVMVEQSPVLKPAAQRLSQNEDLNCILGVSKDRVMKNTSLPGLLSPEQSHRDSIGSSLDRSLDEVDTIPGAVKEKNLPENDMETELLMTNLYNDYTACIQQIKALQEKLEMALDGMFITGANTTTTNPKMVGSNDRRYFAREVDRSVWDTYDCLEQRIFQAGAHKRIIEQTLTGDNASLFNLVTRKKNHIVDKTDAEAPGPEHILRNWFVPKNGINRQVISADIQKYLGNDATVRPGKDKELEGYWIKAYRNLTSEMINDLRVASTKWEQEQRSGRRGAYEDSHTYKQGTDSGNNGSGSYRASTNSPQLGYLPLNGHVPHITQRMPVPEMPTYNDPRGMYPPHSTARITTAFGDPSIYASHPPRTPANGYGSLRMPQYEPYERPYPASTPMPDQPYTCLSPLMDPLYRRERPSAPPGSDRGVHRRRLGPAAAPSSLDPVDDLLNRWTHLYS